MKSQITKDFDLKSKLRALADGGSVAPAPTLPLTGAVGQAQRKILGRRAQIDSIVDAADAPAPAASAPAPQPERKMPVTRQGGIRGFFGLADGGEPQRPFEPKIGSKSPLRGSSGGGLSPEAVRAAQAPAPAASQPTQEYLLNRKAVLRKREEAAGLADGGEFRPGEEYDDTVYQQLQLRDGGRVEGPGGRTEDKVGPVMLSDDEYVLPGDTADAIGRDKLDEIRLATHDFKDAKKGSALRKEVKGLADGGSPWIVDPEGRVSGPRGSVTPPRALPGPGMPPPQYGVPATQQPVPQARTVVNMGPVTEVPAAQASRAQRVGQAVGRAAGPLRAAAGGLATTAPLAGFGDYAADTGGVDTSVGGTLGYLGRGEFGNAATSLSGGAGEALADAGRGVAKTGDFLSGLVGAKPDLTGRYDRAVSSATNGYLGLRTPAAANPGVTPVPSAGGGDEVPRSIATLDPAAGPSWQQQRLAEMGVSAASQAATPLVGAGGPAAGRDILRNAGTDQYQNLGTYGGNANIYGRTTPGGPVGRMNDFAGVGPTAGGAEPAASALRGLSPTAPGAPVVNDQGRLASGAGFGLIPDSRNSPEARLERDIRNTYSAKGQGNMIRQLQGLRESTARSADAAAARDVTRDNALLAADTSRSNADLASRTNLAEAAMREGSALRTSQATLQLAQLKALQDAQKTAREGEEKGFERYNTAIGSMFTTVDADGKQTVDKARQEQFKDFIQRSDPKAGEKFSAMGPQQQSALLAQFKTAFDANQVRNETATRGSPFSSVGGTTNAMDLPTQVREAEFADVWNRNLPVKDYVWSNLPGTNRNVVVTESGQPVLYSDYTSTGGATDLDKQKLVEDSINRRKSPLRSN